MSDDQQAAREYPWWFPGWPDGRHLCGAGVFMLLAGIFWMIHDKPALLDSTPFMQLVTGIAATLGIVVSFHFGTSAGTAKANQRADNAERRAAVVETAASGGASGSGASR